METNYTIVYFLKGTTIIPQFILTNKAYDVLRSLVQIWLPAFSALYAALGVIWGLPYTQQVVGTVAAITVFLGTCLGISRKNYNVTRDKRDDDLVDSR